MNKYVPFIQLCRLYMGSRITTQVYSILFHAPPAHSATKPRASLGLQLRRERTDTPVQGVRTHDRAPRPEVALGVHRGAVHVETGGRPSALPWTGQPEEEVAGLAVSQTQFEALDFMSDVLKWNRICRRKDRP